LLHAHGRRFFNEDAVEHDFLKRVQASVGAVGLWEEFKTDWIRLDCELMPWSSKAQELLVRQYAPAGPAGRAGLRVAVAALRTSSASLPELGPIVAEYEERARMVGDYVEAYRRYCWPVHSLLDLKLAPFHILLTEGQVHTDKDHMWHMDVVARLCQQGRELQLATPYKVIDLHVPSSEEEGTAWWEELTGARGEGMVVKPFNFVHKNEHLVQPAVKCRRREYLRIIYGPEYTLPRHLERLRSRGLGRKRSLALREFALGIKRCSDLSIENLCAGCMSASLVCWR
jgi:protein phosphatase